VNVTRAQVLAYRTVMHGLAGAPPDDALLDLGVQDTPPGVAAQALSVRGLDGSKLLAAWTFRGAPHLHRAADCPLLRPRCGRCRRRTRRPGWPGSARP
jgi:hypothetical protein